MLNWFFNKNLNEYLKETRKIKISGFSFVIKKANALNYLDGSKVLKQTFDTYKNKSQELAMQINDKKVIEHITHVLCGCVVHPKLTLKKEDSGIFVEDLFVDWELVLSLYNEIMLYTYGKKKTKQLSFQEKS